MEYESRTHGIYEWSVGGLWVDYGVARVAAVEGGGWVFGCRLVALLRLDQIGFGLASFRLVA